MTTPHYKQITIQAHNKTGRNEFFSAEPFAIDVAIERYLPASPMQLKSVIYRMAPERFIAENLLGLSLIELLVIIVSLEAEQRSVEEARSAGEGEGFLASS